MARFGVGTGVCVVCGSRSVGSRLLGPAVPCVADVGDLIVGHQGDDGPRCAGSGRCARSGDGLDYVVVRADGLRVLSGLEAESES